MSALISPATMSRPLLLGGLIVGLLAAGAASLWAWYGTAVFFEVIRAGWMACF